MSEGTTNVAGVRLHWLSQGEGAPVLFLHGFSSDLHSWDQSLGRIPGARTIALDLPGHGLSDKPWTSYSASYYARMVRGFLEATGTGPVSLVGLSLGGLIAGRVAIDYPDLVTRLVLVDAAGVGAKPQSWASRLQFVPMLLWQALGIKNRRVTREFLTAVLGDPALATDSLVDLSLKSQQQSRLASFLTGLTLTRPDAQLYPHLSRIQAPTLVIWGERDSVFPLADAFSAAARIPDAHVAVVPGAGHGPNLQAPGIFVGLLRSFLGREG